MSQVRVMLRALLCTLPLALGCAKTLPEAATPTHIEQAGALHGPVRVLDVGPRDGEPVVLVHGLSARGLDDFAAIIPALAQQHRVLAFDLPGFAGSDAPGRVHKPGDYVALIDQLIAARFDGRVNLVGHSMGGALALAYAAEHPERVARLALFDVAGVLYFRDYARRVVDARLRARGSWLDPFRRLAYALFRVGTKPFAHKELDELPVSDGPVIQFASYDFGDALRHVSAEVMLGWGAQDQGAPERTHRLLRFWLRPTRDVTYAQSGHVPMVTEPEAVARDLLGFMRGRPSGPSGPRPMPAAAELPSYRCKNERGVHLTGDYDTIVLEGCKDVRIERARARSLEVRSSSVELVDVELRDAEVAVTSQRSRISWVGGRIRSEVCFVTGRSRLDLAGVHCQFERRSLLVEAPSRLMASVSAVEGLAGLRALHGEYALARNVAPEAKRSGQL